MVGTLSSLPVILFFVSSGICFGVFSEIKLVEKIKRFIARWIDERHYFPISDK